MKLINNKDKILEPTDLFPSQPYVDEINTKLLCDELRELREVEDKFYKIFDFNPCPMAINSLDDNTFVDVNQSFLDIIEVEDKKTILGKSPSESGANIVNKKDKLYVIECIKRDGMIRNYPIIIRTLKGNEYKSLFSGSFIVLNGKECILTVCHIIDCKKIF